MKVNSYYPVITVSDVAATAGFYETNFGFQKGFDSGWYVHLIHPENPGVNLAVMEASHDSLPDGYRKEAQGLLLNFEVEDVDAVYDRMTASDVKILRPLKDEPWGQRHFIMCDPAGVMIDVIKMIPPTAEFAEQYEGDALPN